MVRLIWVALGVVTICGKSNPALLEPGMGRGENAAIVLEVSNFITVCQYNIRATKDEYPLRKTALEKLIPSLDTHVLSMQESKGRSQHKLMDSALVGKEEQHYHVPTIADMQMVIKPPSGWQAKDHFTHKFKTGFRYRGVILQVFVEPGGERVLVGDTHLDWESAEGRLSQAREVLDFITAQNIDRAIFTCDCNGEPDEPFYAEFIRAGFLSAYAHQHGADPKTYKAGSDHTDEGDVLSVSIDFIFYKNMEVADVHLIGTEPVSTDRPNLFPSDHLGICGSFSLPGPMLSQQGVGGGGNAISERKEALLNRRAQLMLELATIEKGEHRKR